MTDCPGHFGFIKLALPVFHVGYFRHTVAVLQVVCKGCSRVLLSEEDRERRMARVRTNAEPSQNLKVLKATIDECRKMRECAYCGAYNGIVKKAEGLKVIHAKYALNATQDIDDLIKQFEYSCQVNPDLERNLPDTWEDLDPLRVQEIFAKIRDEDIPLFHMRPDLCRPADLLITHVPAPPVCIRPSVATATDKSEDDLTVKLAEMAAYNKEIQRVIARGLGTHKLVENWNMLQWTAALYLNAETAGLPRNLLNGRKPIRALSQRLKGKGGRFRHNLSGKRVDFTGRTVISPDPNCAIDEVIVPTLMAKVLTFPDTVSRYNIDKLRQLVKNGPEMHPGANYVEVKQSDGTFDHISLRYAPNRTKIADELKIGDVVERHLANGDAVLFNRQPSLHRVSIMCHKARIMPNRTLRFNECVCAPYNADFDGDEMNIHVPQTEEARAEVRTLMDVKNNICVPKAGEPLIAATQDFVATSFLLTQKDMFFNRSEMMQACGYFCDANERVDLPPPAILKPVELWTGKQVISVMLRPNRQCRVQVNTTLEAKNYSGRGEAMCESDGFVIFQNSEHLCGNLCKKTVGGGSKTGLFYSLIRDNTVEVAAACMLRLSKFSARWLSHRGFSIGISDVTPFPELTAKKQRLVRQADERCARMIDDYQRGTLALKAGCDLEQSLESGLNGVLGEVREEAGRTLRQKLPKHNVALTMAVCGSKGSDRNLGQMIACVGQQTVNGKRMPNGFLDRSLPHFEPHSKYPAAKGFVANSFYTGLTATEFFFHTVGGREGLVDTAVKTAETGYMQRRLMKAMEDLVIRYDRTVRSSNETIIQFTYGDDGLDPMFMDDRKLPVSLHRLWVRVKEATKKQAQQEPLLTAGQVRQLTGEAIAECPIKNVGQKWIGERSVLRDFMETKAKEIEQALGVVQANDDRLLRNFTHLTRGQLNQFMELVWQMYERAMIQPGEACGAVAAQSIGEPATQMTLKTFHFAGVASMNVTLGVPRMQEIINATPKISTPIIAAKLVNDADVIAARLVKGRIEKTELGDVAEYIKEVYTPQGCYLSVKIDLKAIAALQLDVSVESICASILKAPKLRIKERHLSVVKENKIHIEPYDDSRDKMYFVMQDLKSKLPRVNIKGIPSVTRAVISTDKSGAKYELAVEGYGLSEVMRTPGVDFSKTSTNHTLDVCEVLGIEAARQKIISEIEYLMNEYGIQIDRRHTQLLADEMTFKGKVLGIQRFGVAASKASTLQLASFEETEKHLYNAAIQCKKDDIKGVSECIVMGNQVPMGTGMMKVIYDESVAKQAATSPAKRSTARRGPASDALLFDSVE